MFWQFWAKLSTRASVQICKMADIYFISIFILGIMALTSCAESEEVTIVNDDIEDIIELEMTFDSIISVSAFQAIPTTAGIHSDNIELNNGDTWNYELRVPSLEPGETAPLIIGLVWAGDENDHQTFFNCLLEPAFGDSESFLFVPADDFGIWSDSRVEQRILEFVDYASQFWPVNPDQIAVAGYSIGGTGAWHYAINHDSIFSASIPMASTHGSSKNPQIPIYGICGGEDDLVDCSFMEVQVFQSSSQKSAFQLEPNLSHFEACQYQQSLFQAANWLDQVVFTD